MRLTVIKYLGNSSETNNDIGTALLNLDGSSSGLRSEEDGQNGGDGELHVCDC